jgi:hypothetical protein
MLLACSAPAQEINYDKFAQCLNKKGASMYGAFWCPHCKEQKEKFGSSFLYVNYVECGVQTIPLDRTKQTDACKDKNIHRYPTWIFTETAKIVVLKDTNASPSSAGSPGATNGNGATPTPAKSKPTKLNTGEKAIVDALTKAGGRMPLTELQKVSVPKTTLPALEKRGLVEISDETKETERLEKILSLEELGEKTGCQLPKAPPAPATKP